MKKIMVVVGTRPELVKLSPIVHAAEYGPLEPVVVSTGQHAEMVRAMAADLDIELHHELADGQPGMGLSGTVAQVLETLPAVIVKEQPHAILVQGDTGSALAGALAGYYERVPVAHVEAGLRTADPFLPFPEEINRRLITRLTTLHLAPTLRAVHNLIREGVPAHEIELTGNTVIDALMHTRRHPPTFADPRIAQWANGPERPVLVTMHRRESWGTPSLRVASALRILAQALPSLRIVVVMHANSAAREPFQRELDGLPGVLLSEPLGYREMAHLLGQVALVLTDSGGLQEEAPALGTPVLVLRDRTERTEALDAGAAILVGCDTARIVHEVLRLLESDPVGYAQMATPRHIYGDGHAAQRVVRALERLTPADARRPSCSSPAISRASSSS